jgi:hypothetical protein
MPATHSQRFKFDPRPRICGQHGSIVAGFFLSASVFPLLASCHLWSIIIQLSTMPYNISNWVSLNNTLGGKKRFVQDKRCTVQFPKKYSDLPPLCSCRVYGFWDPFRLQRIFSVLVMSEHSDLRECVYCTVYMWTDAQVCSQQNNGMQNGTFLQK